MTINNQFNHLKNTKKNIKFNHFYITIESTGAVQGTARALVLLPAVAHRWKAWVYPIIVAWTWGYGWLASVTSVGAVVAAELAAELVAVSTG